MHGGVDGLLVWMQVFRLMIVEVLKVAGVERLSLSKCLVELRDDCSGLRNQDLLSSRVATVKPWPAFFCGGYLALLSSC